MFLFVLADYKEVFIHYFLLLSKSPTFLESDENSLLCDKTKELRSHFSVFQIHNSFFFKIPECFLGNFCSASLFLKTETYDIVQ